MRELMFVFQEPGMIEAVATDPTGANDAARPTGYADSVVPDLLMDRIAESLRPYAWMCYNFERTYPLVIWGLRLFAADEHFNVPQAGLTNVPLHLAFSWAYHHFILQDGALLSEQELSAETASNDYTHVVLSHALTTAG
jgi:hypothetical protein